MKKEPENRTELSSEGEKESPRLAGGAVRESG